MTYVGRGQCLPVDIRGPTASVTTAQFWQVRDLYTLHIEISHCSSEDNFGFNQVVSGKFRCTLQNGETTQWWFGAYMTD